MIFKTSENNYCDVYLLLRKKLIKWYLKIIESQLYLYLYYFLKKVKYSHTYMNYYLFSII